MPRTKYTRSSKVRSKFSISNVKKEKTNTEYIDVCIANFERDANTALLNFKNRTDSWIESIEHIANDEFVVINPIQAKKTLRQLRTEKSTSASSMKSTMFETASMLKHLNYTCNTTVTASTNKNKKKQTDEAGESASSGDSDKRKRLRSSSTSRQSRQTERAKPKTRTSRSLSRSKAPQKNVTINAAEKKTPDRAMRPPMTFGTVTPKMKPNMPLSILRRPNQGEMAISMQGSPLLVSGVITERCANVNIPLSGGRILSLQPSRALRMSEIPHLDEHTRRQLAQLRDNLSKVVKIAYDDDDD